LRDHDRRFMIAQKGERVREGETGAEGGRAWWGEWEEDPGAAGDR